LTFDDRASSHSSDAMDDLAARRAGLFFAAILVASALAPAAAAIAAGFFGAMDCAAYVCQLAPYGLAAVVAGMALLAGPGVIRYRTAVVACAVVFAAGCALSLFREGMQEGWWSMSGLCDDPAPALSGWRSSALLDRSSAALCDAGDTARDDVVFATVNFAYSAVMTFVCAVTAAVNDFGRSEG
jgi:hypothetical protein